MRVVIITGTKSHHKHLCAVLAKEFDVVGIIHPIEPHPGTVDQIRRLARRRKTQGSALVGLHLLAKLLPKPKEPDWNPKPGEPGGVEESLMAYERINKSLIHPQRDVQQPSTHELLRTLKPDVTVCLGGPVYPAAFIKASPLTLNFHSGISPIYNGTASIQFAFANGHPHLCGGTLMIMNDRVDGGGILGHFLPAIGSGDSPRSLFAKTVQGATLMYVRLLKHLAVSGASLSSIPQSPPLFYTRGLDFSWYHNLAIAQNLRVNVAAKHLRPESIVEYWRTTDNAQAQLLYQSTLNHLLWTKGEQKKK